MPHSNGRAVQADGHRNPLPNGSGRLIGFGEAPPALRRIDVDPEDCRRNLAVRQEPVLPIRSALFHRQVGSSCASYYREQNPDGPGTPEGDLSRKVSNRAGLLFALVSLECSVEGGAVDVEHLGEVVEVHAGVE